MRWTSLLHRDWPSFSPVIRVPSNVLSVIPFHQTICVPMGHRIVGGRYSHSVRSSIELPVTHLAMDSWEDFLDVCLDEALKL